MVREFEKRHWITSALRRSPAQPLYRWRASRRLTVLAYHGVGDAERFSQHLDEIVRTMQAVSIEDVVAAVNGRRGLPRRAVLITFDDGERSVYNQALPLLRARGLPAVLYVVAGLIDTDTPFWWEEVRALAQRGGTVPGYEKLDPRALAKALKYVSDGDRREALELLRWSASRPAAAAPQLRGSELREMESAGMAIGNHTLTHPCLNRCPEETIRREVEEAHHLLTEILGHPPTSFAYPNGGEDDRVAQAVAAAGYRAAFLFDHRQNTLPLRDPLRISRVRIDADASLDRFRIIASGLHSDVLHALGRVQTGPAIESPGS